MLESAATLVQEYADLEAQLGEPAVHSDQALVRKLNKRYAALAPTVAAYHVWHTARDDVAAARELATEDRAFAEELPALEAVLAAAEDKLRRLLVPRDPDDDRDIILEVKAGEGGDESALFAGDLLRMYMRYAERRGWKTEIIDSTLTGLGGVKDATVAVKAGRSGTGAWSRLKYEGGVH